MNGNTLVKHTVSQLVHYDLIIVSLFGSSTKIARNHSESDDRARVGRVIACRCSPMFPTTYSAEAGYCMFLENESAAFFSQLSVHQTMSHTYSVRKQVEAYIQHNSKL